MRMDINQIVELWRGLSPHLAGASHSKELPDSDHFDEERSDEDDDDKTAGLVDGLREEVDV